MLNVKVRRDRAATSLTFLLSHKWLTGAHLDSTFDHHKEPVHDMKTNSHHSLFHIELIITCINKCVKSLENQWGFFSYFQPSSFLPLLPTINFPPLKQYFLHFI
jgi:hypothetical protein